MMDWTVEARDEIADMLQKGLSASQIAVHFDGVSRNAVIGIVHRDKRLSEIGFKRSAGPQHTERSRKPRKPRSSRPRVVHPAPLRMPAPEPVVALGAPQTAGIPLLMLGPLRCKWCVNDPEPGTNGHLFCGETTNGGSYCGYHATMAVGSGTESERSAERIALKAAA